MEQVLNEITINGTKYYANPKQEEINGDIKIVILQRGWVMVGKFERNGSDCKLHNASVIRVWGTKKGLGEIALSGPTKDTILDKTNGVVEFDYLTVVASIAVKEDSWVKYL